MDITEAFNRIDDCKDALKHLESRASSIAFISGDINLCYRSLPNGNSAIDSTLANECLAVALQKHEGQVFEWLEHELRATLKHLQSNAAELFANRMGGS
jgi:hypothetical protein